MIGPVVGILSGRHPDDRRPFGEQSTFFSQMIAAAKQLGQIVYAFSPSNVNWSKKTVRGYGYANGQWFRANYPLPNVVYPRESGYSRSILPVRKRLQEAGCIFINPPLIGKWRTFKILSVNDELLENIPDTQLVNNFDQVDKMLNKYQAVYIKPVKGSQGRNIIKVDKKKDSKVYEFKYQLNNQIFSGKVKTIKELRKQLSLVMGNKTYIVQRQINLLRTENKLIDIRILVQKDQNGEWTITGKACRVGRTGSITSNISAGGNAYNVEDIISRYFQDPQDKERIINEVNRLALQSAANIEKKIGATGEFGIDIGVDKNGQVWFIEANLKPGRQVFNLIGDKATRMKSIEKPLLYARYLANF